MNNQFREHISVLKNEVLKGLEPQVKEESFLVIDGTLGEGGHTCAMLKAWPGMQCIGVDADPVMLIRAEKNLYNFGKKVSYHHAWFDDFLINYTGQNPLIILLDLGVSMFHLTQSQRGFSFYDDVALDMRLEEASSPISAHDIINFWSEKELAAIFQNYADIKNPFYLASLIIKKRPIKTARQLGDIIWYTSKKNNHRVHPATKVFQALRIAVNQDLKRLELALTAGLEILAPLGKLGIITFHSIEDRIVKKFFLNQVKKTAYIESDSSTHNADSNNTVFNCSLIFPKGISPRAEEILDNPSSRSARLRIIQKGSPYYA